MKHARNVLIVLAIAALAAFSPEAGVGVSFLSWLLGIAFLAAMAWFVTRTYREYRVTLYSLGDRRRAILYVAAGVVVLTFTATSRLWQTGAGTVAWLGLLAACGFAFYSVYRSARDY
ncbi:MAG: hypothetical protein M3Z33_09840 [Actinomycetota bacterium]|nr:hypothetical protein [Actinomycetota bacterium]